MNQNLRWKCTRKKFETPNVKRVTTASLLKLYFCSLYKQKMDMDISSDSSSSDEATGAYWDSNIGLPFTDRVSDEEFWQF